MNPSTISCPHATWVSVVLGLLGVAAIWVMMDVVIAEVSDWRSLRQEFKANGKPDGQSFYNDVHFPGGRSRSWSTVHLIISESGLYLALIPVSLFPMYPPLLIPWSSISKQ